MALCVIWGYKGTICSEFVCVRQSQMVVIVLHFAFPHNGWILSVHLAVITQSTTHHPASEDVSSFLLAICIAGCIGACTCGVQKSVLSQEL